MTLAAPTITVYFGLTGTGGNYFTLDHPVKGRLDNTTYKLAGDVGTNLTADAYSIDIARGRSRDLDEFQAGTATVQLRNFSGAFSALNPSSPYYGKLLPGKRVTIAMYSQVIFDGVVEAWSSTQRRGGDCDATFTATDALGQLARMELAGFTATAGQKAGARIAAVLNRGEVNFGTKRDLDTGVSTLQADVVATGTNVLSYLQTVSASDQGRFFVSRNGTITFRDRHHLHPTTDPQVIFVDNNYVGESIEFLDRMPFAELGTVAGADLLFTRVAVTREGGTTQTVSDTAGQAEYGIRTLGVTGLLMDSDSQSLSMAEYLRGKYKVPRERVSSVDVFVDGLAERGKNAAQVALLDIASLVEVEYTPLGSASEVTHRLLVDGLQHRIDTDQGHHMTVFTSTVDEVAMFRLDHATYGRLDRNRLGF